MTDWRYDCLEQAKNIIIRCHSPFCGCDSRSFFDATSFELFVQHDRRDAYAYIQLAPGSSHFPIGIHPALSERTPYYERALIVVFVHELLHAIHRDWGHDKIRPQERLLANKAGYFDALVELERLAVSGRMRICDK